MVAEVNRHLDIVGIATPIAIHILPETVIHRWLLVQSLQVLANSYPS